MPGGLDAWSCTESTRRRPGVAAGGLDLGSLVLTMPVSVRGSCRRAPPAVLAHNSLVTEVALRPSAGSGRGELVEPRAAGGPPPPGVTRSPCCDSTSERRRRVWFRWTGGARPILAGTSTPTARRFPRWCRSGHAAGEANRDRWIALAGLPLEQQVGASVAISVRGGADQGRVVELSPQPVAATRRTGLPRCLCRARRPSVPHRTRLRGG